MLAILIAFGFNLTYLATHKAIIVGAASCIAELVVIMVNLYRRLKAKKESRTRIEFMGLPLRENSIPVEKNSLFKDIMWSANPINLLRKPQR